MSRRVCDRAWRSRRRGRAWKWKVILALNRIFLKLKYLTYSARCLRGGAAGGKFVAGGGGGGRESPGLAAATAPRAGPEPAASPSTPSAPCPRAVPSAVGGAGPGPGPSRRRAWGSPGQPRRHPQRPRRRLPARALPGEGRAGAPRPVLRARLCKRAQINQVHSRDGRRCLGNSRPLICFCIADLSDVADEFENELSLANGPSLTKPIYSKAGLQCASELQKGLYPVGSNEIKWKPETICTDLFSEYPGLEDLTKKQIHPLNKGIPVFSRSWVVDTGLPKTQDVMCDVLLVTENVYPVLYTVVKDASSAESENSRETAYALKQKLVSDRGYASKMSVIPQILHLNDTKNQMEVAENDVPQEENLCDYTSLYPEKLHPHLQGHPHVPACPCAAL
ncbi:uncharacterized protein LOC141968498 [Athene noctua]|uniref:uncharacterized protein LOC141968498 n=1 Tax=Athene noctua TaxID=126797 RepID=UPI003EBD3418